MGLPEYFASEAHYRINQRIPADEEPSWLGRQSAFAVAPPQSSDHARLRDQVKFNLNFLQPSPSEKFIADRDSLTRKSASHYPSSDENQICFDLLGYDEMHKGWVTKQNSFKKDSSHVSKASSLNGDADIVEGEARVKMTALIVKVWGPRTFETVQLMIGQRDGNIMDKEMRTRSTRPAVRLSDTGIFEALGTLVVEGDAEGTEEA